VASLVEVGGCGTLEEAVADGSCRVAAVASASRAVVEVCSSSRKRVMARMRARALTTFFSAALGAGSLSEMCDCKVVASVDTSLTV
jgi:hypothetical protein